MKMGKEVYGNRRSGVLGDRKVLREGSWETGGFSKCLHPLAKALPVRKENSMLTNETFFHKQ